MLREFSFYFGLRKIEEDNLLSQKPQSPLKYRTIVMILLTTTIVALQVTRLAQLQLSLIHI